MNARYLLLFTGLLFSSSLSAAERMSPYFSDEVINNIINELSGEKALYNTIMLAPYEMNRDEEEYTGHYRESAYTLKKLKEYGFSESRIETFMLPAEEWDGVAAELWITEPEERKICDYDELTPCLAVGSGDANITAELIDVGVGDRERDYEGIDVRGKIVFGSGRLNTVYNLAVKNNGAAGIVVFNDSPVSIDQPDQVFWVTSSIAGPGERAQGFAFNLTRRQGHSLRQYLRRGTVTARAEVKAAYYPEKIEVPTALIPGNGETGQEIIFLAHIFDKIPKQGANDNISGSAAILEIGRTILQLLKENKIPPLRRDVRFIWIPEVIGTTAYLRRYPEEIKRLIAGINLDMVGEGLKLCDSVFKITQTPHSLPSYINAVFRHSGELSFELQDRLTTVTGTRDLFHYRFLPYQSGTDHLVLNDSYLNIPSVYLGCTPDNFYHSSEDLPDKTDPTMLKRAMFVSLYGGLIIGCAAPGDAVKMMPEVYSLARQNIADEFERVMTMLNEAQPAELAETYYKGRNFVRNVYGRETRSVESLNVFAEGNDGINKYIAEFTDNLSAAEKNSMDILQNHYRYLCRIHGVGEKEYKRTEREKMLSEIIPVKKAPLDRILADYFARPTYKTFAPWRAECQEVLNFIDGRRSILDIADALEIEFNRPYLGDTEKYMEMLKESGFIDY